MNAINNIENIYENQMKILITTKEAFPYEKLN